MCLSGQPALKVRLAASSKRDGNEWTWVVKVASTAAAVWAERTCEVAGDKSRQDLLPGVHRAVRGKVALVAGDAAQNSCAVL